MSPLLDDPGTWAPLIFSALALVLGGVLKGATGAGAPIVAVPIIALYFDVQTAVATLMLPNLLSNAVQGWRYRRHLPPGGFAWQFAGGGLVGAILGTVLLAHAAQAFLLILVSVVVFLYIGFRLARPEWRLSMAHAARAVGPAGLAGGVLQGATGVSAPASITFLNAIGLERPVFVAVISLYFMCMTMAQIPSLVVAGLMGPQEFALSAGALALILAALPLGEFLARHIRPVVFDRLILCLLGVVAIKILFSVL